ncbi:glycine--tRNA ligase subunit beta [Nitratidesulfovibrio sp. HK-II]|uniref:glycine--tRNA ligase subunit beta n=1 Tax=Nitratidesulfovibrio sp. HK-II TaxID=2009266 RepID=UPI000E2ED397|nr:glycine--tRNA ligase subunit beta [Nitratidesulfovibrio sp. HK-II]GBO96018.1 glycyl-tRNA synthetase beta chain [Nitratidesulfovibrio sp. HK-II]
MSQFVLEIGFEELPSRFLPGLERELAERFARALDDAGVEHESIRVLTTPRRAAVLIEGINPVQREAEEVVPGPPVRVAYDAEGKPTKAAEGFARTQGVDMADIFTLSTDKGEYIAVRKRTGGAQAADLIAAACPAIIAALPFPKRMRWGSGDFTFGRPLRWLLALFDDAVTPFEVGGVISGGVTWGHRIHGAGPLVVKSAADYLNVVTEKGGVMPDPAERRVRIIESGNAAADAAGGRILWKESLLDEVQGLAEHPVPLLGDIDPSFLELPREVLLTSMESHQKSFGVEGPDGALLPHFLTVLNLTPLDEALVKKGWERVLRARLEDGRFFWKTDLAASFDAWLAELDNVIFLGPLGSMGDKTRRLEKLCAWLAKASGVADEVACARAGRLSKADLVSEMVGEFDTLQGIMGSIYARRMGEQEVVAAALAEQYLPAGPDSPVPATPAGALLSIADKADTMAGCFGLGMIPTGAADPYALRRCALGIARIVLERGLRIDVRELFRAALALYGERAWKLAPAEALAKLEEFFMARLKNHFMAAGYETLLVEAALAADTPEGAGVDVRAAGARLAALADFSRREDFGSAVLTFKRAANIIRKQGQEGGVVLDGTYRHDLLAEDAEKALAARLEEVAPRFDALWAADDFASLFGLLGELRPAVDAFFDGVMVMCDDAALRGNRLNLLKALVLRLGRLADFGALQM